MYTGVQVMAQSEFVGVDNCTYGWFSVGFNGSGDEYELKAFSSFGELLAYYEAAKLILVDMPIGLPDRTHGRDCDWKAKKALGNRHSTVFLTPTRATVEHFADKPRDKNGANTINYIITQKFISPPTFGIMPKMCEVDRAMLLRGPNVRPEVREIHPEVCFWALNNRRAVISKKENAGLQERIRVLKIVEPRTERILEDSRSEFLRKWVAGKDDILDALAAAVTAYRGYPCEFQTLPVTEPPQIDSRGLTMEMLFWEPFRRCSARSRF